MTVATHGDRYPGTVYVTANDLGPSAPRGAATGAPVRAAGSPDFAGPLDHG